jgi:aryl-alcohol dehydrogenase
MMEMQAAVLRATSRDFAIERLDIDEPRAGEVLVRVHAAGICHTDISARDGHLGLPLPLVLGHEGAGVVARVGAGVTDVAAGDHVLLSWDSCGHCRVCEQGDQAYCEQWAARNISGRRPDGSCTLYAAHDGSPVHGSFFSQSSFATYALATQRSVVKVPRDLDVAVLAPFGCSIQTGAGTVINRLRPAAGSSIAIFGTGAVGSAAVMAARLVGCAPIIGVDVNPARLAIAREVGATHVLNPTQVDIGEQIHALLGGGADYSIDTTAIPQVMRQAVEVLGVRGSCALLGMATQDVSLNVMHLLAGGRTVTGVSSGDSRPREFIPELVELFRQGRLPVDRLVRTYPFSSINEAFAASESGDVIKAVLLME